jgi:hypothetical protein
MSLGGKPPRAWSNMPLPRVLSLLRGFQGFAIEEEVAPSLVFEDQGEYEFEAPRLLFHWEFDSSIVDSGNFSGSRGSWKSLGC